MKFFILLIPFFLISCTKDFGQYELIDKVISHPDSTKSLLQTGKIQLYPEMDSLYFYHENSLRTEQNLINLFKGFTGNYIDRTPFLEKISVFKIKNSNQSKEFHEVRIASEDEILRCSFAFIKVKKQWYLHSIKDIARHGQYYDLHYDTTNQNNE